MTIIVGMYRGGIIVAETSTESAALLGTVIREGIEGGASAFSAGSDAAAIWESIATTGDRPRFNKTVVCPLLFDLNELKY